MIAIPTTIPDLLIIEPKVFGDDRSFFFESFNRRKFAVLSDSAGFLCKTNDYWILKHEYSTAWNDPAIGIYWPLEGKPVLSAKDQQAKSLAEAGHFA